MNPHFWSRRGARLGAAACALLVFLGLSGLAVHRAVWADDQPGGKSRLASTRPALPVSPLLAEMNNAFTAIADRMQPSVVMIRVERNMRSSSAGAPDMGDLFRGFPGGPDNLPFAIPRTPGTPRTFRAQGAGSGVIVSPDGWILTNDHVVGGADKVTVVLHDGREFQGTVRRDYRSDIALVKIAANGLDAADLGDSDRVKVGQWVLAFGSPFELSDTMTAGIVSAMHRQTTISEGADRRDYPSLLQTDAPINPGNSGGPLVDIYGRVVGINVAINSPTGTSVGIGFAIPVNTAHYVIDQLMSSGRVVRGYMGVGVRSLADEDRKRYGVSQGALVAQVEEGSPAARAGLQVEDVVTRFNGRAVKDFYDLTDMVARTKPGGAFDAVVRRGGRDVTLHGSVEAMPERVAMGQDTTAPQEPAAATGLGVRVQPITPDLARRYNLGSAASGVVVTEVQDGSVAGTAGIQPGDVIQRVNGRQVASGADITAAVRGAKSGDTVNVVLQRGRSRMLVAVTMP